MTSPTASTTKSTSRRRVPKRKINDSDKSPLEIEFRSGFGYGDFISGLAYAHNASIRYQTPVDITFHWDHSIDHLHDPSDPETVIDRFYACYNDLVKLDDVNVNISCNSSIPYRFVNHLDELSPYHSYWQSIRKSRNDGTIVVWSSRHNTYFPGHKKDPIYDEWQDLCEYLRSVGFTVKEVTYRTPVSEVLDLISRCHMGIGYDGMIHQLFKIYQKPLVVFCKRTSLNQLLVPHASLESSYDRFLRKGPDYYRHHSLKKLKNIQNKYQNWLRDYQDPTQHPLYNKVQY